MLTPHTKLLRYSLSILCTITTTRTPRLRCKTTKPASHSSQKSAQAHHHTAHNSPETRHAIPSVPRIHPKATRRHILRPFGSPRKKTHSLRTITIPRHGHRSKVIKLGNFNGGTSLHCFPISRHLGNASELRTAKHC